MQMHLAKSASASQRSFEAKWNDVPRHFQPFASITNGPVVVVVTHVVVCTCYMTDKQCMDYVEN